MYEFTQELKTPQFTGRFSFAKFHLSFSNPIGCRGVTVGCRGVTVVVTHYDYPMFHPITAYTYPTM